MPTKIITQQERARQFLPFDALKGFREACEKESLQVKEKIEFSEDKLNDLNEKLSNAKIGELITVIYYHNKNYLKLTGMLAKIDPVNRYIMIVKEKISLDDIYDIDL